MAENISSLHGAMLDDTQIDTSNCCHSIIRSSISKSETSLKMPTYHVLKPPVKVNSKSIREKYLQQTAKSYKAPTLTVKTASTFQQDRLLSIQQPITRDGGTESQVSWQKRSAIAKRCLQYKNRQIREHFLEPEKPPQRLLFVTPQKQHQNASTQKDTPREHQSLEEESDPSFPEPIPIAESASQLKSQQVAKAKNRGLNLKVSKSKKTLERLYQQQSGRKIEVVESQPSEMDLYSVVEEHDWHLHF